MTEPLVLFKDADSMLTIQKGTNQAAIILAVEDRPVPHIFLLDSLALAQLKSYLEGNP